MISAEIFHAAGQPLWPNVTVLAWTAERPGFLLSRLGMLIMILAGRSTI